MKKKEMEEDLLLFILAVVTFAVAILFFFHTKCFHFHSEKPTNGNNAYL